MSLPVGHKCHHPVTAGLCVEWCHCMSVAVLVQWSLLARVFKTPGNPENLLEFEIASGNTGTLL